MADISRKYSDLVERSFGHEDHNVILPIACDIPALEIFHFIELNKRFVQTPKSTGVRLRTTA